MLAKTQDLEARESEAAGFLESAEPFICVLARLYCRRLFEAVRFGLRQEYVARDEVLPILRGKVHWPSQASRPSAPLLALAKLLLGNRSPDLGRATADDRRSYAVVWDMNVLFEEYVGRVCQDVFEPKGLDVDLQEEGSLHGSASTRRRPTSAWRGRTSTRCSPTPAATPPRAPS